MAGPWPTKNNQPLSQSSALFSCFHAGLSDDKHGLSRTVRKQTARLTLFSWLFDAAQHPPGR